MAYQKCLAYCGKLPGLDVPWLDSTVDWMTGETQDQRRIDDVLERYIVHDATLLHVGIGGSELAKRFSHRCGYIEGLTVGAKEEAIARSLSLYNYTVYRINKFDAALVGKLKHAPYDFIIDNNLGSFACCVHHFHGMMLAFASVLKHGGKILTDRVGLAHTGLNDPNWDLSADIAAIAQKFQLELIAETEFVYALRA